MKQFEKKKLKKTRHKKINYHTISTIIITMNCRQVAFLKNDKLQLIFLLCTWLFTMYMSNSWLSQGIYIQLDCQSYLACLLKMFIVPIFSTFVSCIIFAIFVMLFLTEYKAPNCMFCK